MSNVKTKAKKRGRPATKKNELNGNAVPELFKIEKGIPLPSRGDRAETEEMKKTVIDLIEHMEPGNSFVCRFKNKETISRFLRSEYPKQSFRCSKLKMPQGFARIFRIK